MKLIKKINKLLKWMPQDLFYSTSSGYMHNCTPYTRYNYTKIGTWMRELPIFIELLMECIYYIVTYFLYFTFIRIPWWVFTGLFIPQNVLK